MTQPAKISVLMGVYNGGEYLEAAIVSILNQSFRDFEFIIIDDASTDNSPKVLKEWAERDPRIVLMHNQTNLGLTKTLNLGIAKARGEWIARQDADDRSLPDRFSRQLAFLQRHPEVGIVGTGAWIIDQQGKREAIPKLLPATHPEILWNVILQNPFYHTSTLFKRRLALEHPYDEILPFGQDFELWGRLLHHTQGANLAEPLIESRRHNARTSVRHNHRQQAIGRLIIKKHLQQLLPAHPWPEAVVNQIRAIARSPYPISTEQAEYWLLLLNIFIKFTNRANLDSANLIKLKEKLFNRLAASLLSFPTNVCKKELLSAVIGYDGWRFFKALLNTLGSRIVNKIRD